MSKLCPYCHKDTDGYVKMLGVFSIDLGDTTHKPTLCTADKTVKPKEIKYCFICGRDLLAPEKLNTPPNINYCINDETGDCDIYDNNMHLATICDCLNTTDKVLCDIIIETVTDSIHINDNYTESAIKKWADEYYEDF